jgi:hypothetical protein
MIVGDIPEFGRQKTGVGVGVGEKSRSRSSSTSSLSRAFSPGDVRYLDT